MFTESFSSPKKGKMMFTPLAYFQPTRRSGGRKKEGKRGVCGKCFHWCFVKRGNTYLFSLTKIAHGSFGLGIVEVKSVIIVEVTLENKPHRQNTNK